MINYIEQRVLNTSRVMLENRLTIRETAKKVGFSKTTVHKDVAERLRDVDCNRSKEIRELLDYHIKVRAVRGGLALKRKLKG